MNNKPSIQFNLPDGWSCRFSLEKASDEESGMSVSYENYILMPPKEDELFDTIRIENYLYGETADIDYYAEEYLNSLSIPYSLTPSIDAFVHPCQIDGIEGDYIVRQQPCDPAAEILVRLIRLSYYHYDILISANIKDWEEGYGEDQAIAFLSKVIRFQH